MGVKSQVIKFYLTLRIKKYKFLSHCKRVTGSPKLYQPVLTTGNGKITFGSNVQIGVIHSKGFYSTYCYFEARKQESEIIIGNNVTINNSFSATALCKIIIEDDVLIGDNCTIEDSDGHFHDADKRRCNNPDAFPVHIKKNVFIGSNVVILKGVEIGENSIIGINSVVTGNIPENVVAVGNPARIIRSL